jgi:cystathionine beta-lyase
MAHLLKARNRISHILATEAPAIHFHSPEATYLAWLDCRELGLGDDPATELRRRARVALAHGPDFGTGGAGHARMTIATSPEIITEAVRRMADALA